MITKPFIKKVVVRILLIILLSFVFWRITRLSIFHQQIDYGFDEGTSSSKFIAMRTLTTSTLRESHHLHRNASRDYSKDKKSPSLFLYGNSSNKMKLKKAAERLKLQGHPYSVQENTLAKSSMLWEEFVTLSAHSKPRNRQAISSRVLSRFRTCEANNHSNDSACDEVFTAFN